MILHDAGIDSSSRDRWTPQFAATLAERACRAADLSATDLVLIRFGTNAVYEIVGAGLALRLRRPGTAADAITRQLALAEWLGVNGFPVNRPAKKRKIVQDGLEGAIASFWEWVVEDPERTADTSELGTLLHRFHDLIDRYPAATDFPSWNPLEEIEHRLVGLEQEADGWPAASQLEQMHLWSLQTAADLENVHWRLPAGLIHGDAHVGNVLTSSSGTDFLIDLDAVAQGPREWDLVPTAVAQLRFDGDLRSIRDFSTAYGFDLLRWSGWLTLRRLRELYMTSWLMSVADSSERRAEVDHRVKCLAERDEGANWQAV